MLDLGAAPSSYERSNWLSASVNPEQGSAYFDPPMWQWHQDPTWNGTDATRTCSGIVNANGVAPCHYAGDTIGQVGGNGGGIVKALYPEGNLLVAAFRDPAGNVIGLWQEGDR